MGADSILENVPYTDRSLPRPLTPDSAATRALVLSSGGVDSTTCLALAIQRFKPANVATVSVFYGQRHERELEAARHIASFYRVPHRELDLSAVLADSNNALMAQSTQQIPHGSYARQQHESGSGLISTYVPFRNGLMLSAAAALGMSLFEGEHVAVYLGAHADDAAGDAYPDCTPAFADAMKRAIELGSGGFASVCVPFVNMTKAQVVGVGLSLQVPYELTWSCYEGGEKPCGVCGTCIDRIRAFRANGVEDPVEYA